jgi:hypothetical protein
MRVILKRPRAADDLIEPWEYVAEDSVTRADAFIDDVDAKSITSGSIANARAIATRCCWPPESADG